MKGGNYLSSRVVKPSTLGGEGVRYADSPCGASAYARTEKLPYQGQFRARRRRFPCAAETESAALLCPKEKKSEDFVTKSSPCFERWQLPILPGR